MFVEIFYFCFGFVAAIYFYILFFKEKVDYKDSAEKQTVRLYLNIYFLDRVQVVKNIANSKVPSNRPVIRALAKRVLVRALKDGIVKKVAGNLSQALPGKLALAGIECNSCVIITKPSFACIEIQLLRINFDQFFANKMGVAKSQKIAKIFRVLTLFPSIEGFLNNFLLNFVGGKFTEALPEQIKEKLYNSAMGAEVEAVCCLEKDLGPLLISMIELDEDIAPKDKDSEEKER